MIDWLLSTVWYGSLLAALIALLSLLKPLRWLRIRTRRRALQLFAVAIALLVINGVAAPPERAATTNDSALDRAMPKYHFREVHSRIAAATPAQTLRAVKEVTAGEIPLFQSFTSLRRFGRPGPENILNAPAHLPILDVATRTTFLLLEENDREVVVGTVVVAPRGFRLPAQRDAAWYHALAGPGIAKAAMNFIVQPDAAGTRITTETRVWGTDAATARRFTPYWRTIFPGSWILRVNWLGAIAERAEGAKGADGRK